ncbi:MAG: DNA-methyltransferase [Pyrinomonadaceae bacterium]
MINPNISVYLGDAKQILKSFPPGHFNLIVTSPPYADARKKHYDGITTDKYPEFFMEFHEQFWRVLADDGSFVLNIKDKVIDGVRDRYVWKTIMKLEEAGWRCVDDYIWSKPNAMPGYWKNRLRDEWEYCFHLTKAKDFKMYQEAVRRPTGKWAKTRLVNLNGKSNDRHNSENDSGFGRDLRNWLGKETVLPGNNLSIPFEEEVLPPGNNISVPLVGKDMGHPAVFPVGLPEFFIKLFSKHGNNILDPFAGSGTTGLAASNLGRNAVLIDSKEEYFETMKGRLAKESKRSTVEFISKMPRAKAKQAGQEVGHLDI